MEIVHGDVDLTEEHPSPLWHVTLTLAGDAVEVGALHAGLEALSRDWPFLLSGRYSADRVEVRYWEQGVDVHEVVRGAMRMWEDLRDRDGLPAWPIVGLEVVDRATVHRRGIDGPVVVGRAMVGPLA